MTYTAEPIGVTGFARSIMQAFLQGSIYSIRLLASTSPKQCQKLALFIKHRNWISVWLHYHSGWQL
jgi:hypothetical protein